jgi:hypothetical protein
VTNKRDRDGADAFKAHGAKDVWLPSLRPSARHSGSNDFVSRTVQVTLASGEQEIRAVLPRIYSKVSRKGARKRLMGFESRI